MNYSPGALIRARDREWVVLPESEEDFLVVRPLGGSGAERAGIHLALEPVEPASFGPPDPDDLGDYISCRLLRDACRFGFRSSAGPFRSFGRLSCQPRPYQLVPLLLALKQQTVRLLIADDVGIGKTVEACMIARELLDRAEISRVCVLCPPHLAQQWRKELSEKFNIDAVPLLAGTVSKLERRLPANRSLFEEYPFTIVSTDFIKSDRRRHDFIRACPEFVIVDEAHTCADSSGGRGGSHQRYQLLSKLAEDAERHLVLVTATPHSGKTDAFRSLLTLLRFDFADLPEDLSGTQNQGRRREIARHLVQRRRTDLRHFLQRDTPFPEREDSEVGFQLDPDYKKLFEKVLDYARTSVLAETGDQLRTRIRWWSAISLLRSLASSPAAAVSTLRERSCTSESPDPVAADEIGRKAILDLFDDAGDEAQDVTPGSDISGENESSDRRRLLAFAAEAALLAGAKDTKLAQLVKSLKAMLKAGFRPIVFCRFIPTVEYLTEELRSALPKKVEVVGITSRLAPAEREKRIEDLSEEEDTSRVLVCTDCLSEGINLQNRFNAVIHYDLAWNPTRHEQREGRVDRYGQQSPTVRVLTLYGLDNQIDGIVLDILLRKNNEIRGELGIYIPMPVDSEQVIEAIFEGLLLRAGAGTTHEQMTMFDDFFAPQKAELHSEWKNRAEAEKRTRTIYAQEAIDFGEVAREMEAAEEALGSPEEVESFTLTALRTIGATVSEPTVVGVVRVGLRGVDAVLREGFVPGESEVSISFQPAAGNGRITSLHRTHPWVESLASRIMTAALDPSAKGPASRAGVMRTSAVETRHVLCLLRLRYHILSTIRGKESSLLAEDMLIAAFTGEPHAPRWIEAERVRDLLALAPDANVAPEAARENFIQLAEGIEVLQPEFERMNADRGEQLLQAHRRVRDASGAVGRYRIEHSPADLLGLYIYLPKPVLR